MSLPKPTGLKAPSKISKSATGIPQAKSGIPASAAMTKAQSAIAKSARSAGFTHFSAEMYAEEMSRRLPGPEPQPRPQPEDDYIIGDRVWVGGTKPGFIAFLGETQFAPGEWAGVVLDEPFGKNNGTVAGVPYFQCEPKRGVFARISKLSRTEGTPTAAAPVPPPDATNANSSGPAGDRVIGDLSHSNGTKTPPTLANAASGIRSVTPKLGQLAVSRTSSGSTSSLNRASPPPPLGTPATGKFALKPGDRVLVSGTKMGTLRYIGTTDFHKGNWVGVELDDPMGKNDGAVAGKRYFQCENLYGLFAPVHKVAKLPGSATAPGSGLTTPRVSKLPGSGSGSALRASRERSGSQDSISSISSTASSVSRSRAKTGSRPITLNLTATTSALQKALKEKEEHIEQLLRERDLERSEVARAAAQVDEAEAQLANVKSEYDRFRDEADETVKKMKAHLQDTEKEKSELSGKLEDERRKTEDLQFQIEEESICKDDLEIKTEEEVARLKENEEKLRAEKDRGDKLEKEVARLQASLEAVHSENKSMDDLHTMYLDQIEELTHKLSQMENKVKAMESSKVEDGTKTSQLSTALADKMTQLSETETALDSKKKGMKQLEVRLAELEEEVKAGKEKYQKQQATIDDLTNKLHAKEASSTIMTSEIQDLKNKFEDSQRLLEASKAKSDQLADDKLRLEQQIAELMKNSGDSSSQLSLLNEQLREKDRKLEEQQADLSSFTQRAAKLDSTIENLKQDHSRGVEELISKHKEELIKAQENQENVQTEVEKLQTKLRNLIEEHNEEKDELRNNQEREMTELKNQQNTLQEDNHKLEEMNKANKATIDTVTTEKDNIQYEKEKLDRTVKKLEGDKEGLKTEVSMVKTELEQVKSEHGDLHTQRGNFEEKLRQLTTEKEQLEKNRDKAEKSRLDTETEKSKLTEQFDQLQKENGELKSRQTDSDKQLNELQAQIQTLSEEKSKQKEELVHQSQKLVLAQELQTQLDELKNVLKNTQMSLKAVKSERDTMRTEISDTRTQLNEDKLKLQAEKASLQQQVVDINKRLSDVTSDGEVKQTALQQSLDNTSSLLQQKEQTIGSQQSMITSLEEEKSTLQSYKNSSHQLELERNELRLQVTRLETALAESEANANLVNNLDTSGDPVLDRLKSDKEEAEGQVDFLNSVVVEIQNKNDELKLRLQAMETVQYVNGDRQVESPVKVKAPRLFCDICDVFDLHETEDCPMQAMSDSETGSQHHGSRTDERPYCDMCEDSSKRSDGQSLPSCPHQKEDMDRPALLHPQELAPTLAGLERCKDDIRDLINSTLDDVLFDQSDQEHHGADFWPQEEMTIDKSRENEPLFEDFIGTYESEKVDVSPSVDIQSTGVECAPGSLEATGNGHYGSRSNDSTGKSEQNGKLKRSSSKDSKSPKSPDKENCIIS